MSVATDQENQQRARLTAVIQQITTSLATPKQGSEYASQVVELPLLANEGVSLMNKVNSASYEQLVVSSAFIFAGDFDKALEVVKYAGLTAQSVLDNSKCPSHYGSSILRVGEFR